MIDFMQGARNRASTSVHIRQGRCDTHLPSDQCLHNLEALNMHVVQLTAAVGRDRLKLMLCDCSMRFAPLAGSPGRC